MLRGSCGLHDHIFVCPLSVPWSCICWMLVCRIGHCICMKNMVLLAPMRGLGATPMQLLHGSQVREPGPGEAAAGGPGHAGGHTGPLARAAAGVHGQVAARQGRREPHVLLVTRVVHAEFLCVPLRVELLSQGT